MKKNTQLILALSGFIVFVFLIYYKTNSTNEPLTRDNKNSFNYSIIKKEEILNQKFSIDIRLEKEYYKSDLSRFAYYIKDEYLDKNYDNIFITYYLPGMKPGEGAWATSHFTPDLKIFITSPFYDDSKEDLNINEEGIISSIRAFESFAKPNKTIGVWVQNEKYLTIIFEKNGVYYLNELNISKNKPGKNYQLIVGTKQGKPIYIIEELLNYKPNNDVKLIGEYNDYYTIEENGDLSLFDDKGIIERYKKVNY